MPVFENSYKLKLYWVTNGAGHVLMVNGEEKRSLTTDDTRKCIYLFRLVEVGEISLVIKKIITFQYSKYTLKIEFD